jgi:steroid delta-isomerase-like uncharacterized protein
MSAETNKILSRRFLEEVFSKGKLELIDEIYASNHLNEGPGALPGAPRGPEGIRQLVMLYRGGFPDVQFTVDEQIADGDRVVTRWSAHGTHTGELAGMGIPATNKTVTVSGVTINRCANGKIVESWGIFDQLSFLQQLGVIPMPNQSQG